jgi:hypothetical protein
MRAARSFTAAIIVSAAVLCLAAPAFADATQPQPPPEEQVISATPDHPNIHVPPEGLNLLHNQLNLNSASGGQRPAMSPEDLLNEQKHQSGDTGK